MGIFGKDDDNKGQNTEDLNKDNGGENGANIGGEQGSNTPVPPISTEPVAPVVENIAQRLGQETVKEIKTDEAKPQQATPMLIDLANLSPEMLQTLKSMLNVTPDRVQQKKGNIKIEIRTAEIAEVPRYVVDFKTAKMGLRHDVTLQKDVETLMIDVRFNGDEKYTTVPYKEFMQYDRVAVEVVSQRVVEDIRHEGQVMQRETGRLVEKEVKTNLYFYTVALPDGSKVEIEGKMANA